MKIELIKLLLNKLKEGDIHFEEHHDGWISAIRFPIKESGQLKNIIPKFITGNSKDDFFYHWMADNNEEPIVFENKEDAIQTVRNQAKHLEKRVIFSIFDITGILYKKPKGDTLQFHRKTD
jgi:hypothetical protein